MSERPAVEKVVHDTLALTGRGRDEGPIAWLGRQTTAVVDALVEHGHIVFDPPATVEQVARFLADRSGHPRFSGDLWTQLLQSEQMVDMAYAQAVKQPGAQVPVLREAREVLVGNLRGAGT